MIYLVRQGETDWNLLKKFNGCTDIELNQTGIEQAKVLAQNLKHVKFDACFCSPQKRARQTCDIIDNGNIIFDDRIIEINCGEFEGTEETPESIKLFWQAIKNGEKGTEKFSDFMRRNCDFCDMLIKKYKGKNILIVTHAANARVINYYFNGRPKNYDFSIAIARNGEILTYENNYGPLP